MSNLLRIKSNLYSEKNLRQAIEAYSKLCSIKYEIKNNIIEGRFMDCIYPEETTIKEFENYLISLENLEVLR